MNTFNVDTFHLYHPQAEHPDWERLWERAGQLVLEASPTLNLAAPTWNEKTLDWQRKAKALSTHGKTYLENRQRMLEGSETYLPPFVIWTMHNTCNFRCTYCDNHQGEAYFNLPNQGRLDTVQSKELLAKLVKTSPGLYFCGGEPTLRKDLPELTAHAWSLGFFPLMINTNGSRLHHLITRPEASDWLRQMDVIIVSLDGLSPSSLEPLWGVRREHCEQVLVNLLALHQLRGKIPFKLIVNTVISPDTISEAAAVLDFANDLGIWFSPVPVNHGPEADASLYANPEYQALRRQILDRKAAGYPILGSTALLRRLLYGLPLKCHPTLKPHVDLDGGLYWPCKTESSIHPQKIDLSPHASLSSAYQAGEALLNPKNLHGPGPDQCQADCRWMQNYVSDLYAKGLKRPLASGLAAEALAFAGGR